MNVSSASNAASTAPPTTTAASGSSASALADFEQFLKLFVSQLKYQDPLNPTGGEEFLSQTAQFSTVEQLVNLNRKVSDYQDSMGLLGRSTAAAFVGRTVTAHVEDGEGGSLEVRGRVTRVEYGAGGRVDLGLDDGSSVPLEAVATLSET